MIFQNPFLKKGTDIDFEISVEVTNKKFLKIFASEIWFKWNYFSVVFLHGTSEVKN